MLISFLVIEMAHMPAESRERETETERETERQRQRDRDRETERERERETERERDRETERQRETEREAETDRDRDRDSETELGINGRKTAGWQNRSNADLAFRVPHEIPMDRNIDSACALQREGEEVHDCGRVRSSRCLGLLN